MGAPSGQIPSFFDRSIGLSFGGTPTPSDARIVSQANLLAATWEEDPDSPQIEFSEQGTIRHSFTTNYDTAIGFANNLKRGTILIDSDLNYSRVLSCSINYKRGDTCQIVVVAESLMTSDLPPQEFSIDPIEFSPAIEKHPRYFIYDPVNATGSNSGPPGTTPYFILTPYDLNLCRSQIQASEFFTQAAFEQLVNTIPNPNDPYGSVALAATRQAAAAELISKMLLGIEAPYIPAFRVTWSEFFFYGSAALESVGGNQNPFLNPGGFIQDPTNIIPPDFWSVDGSGAANTNILLPYILGGAMDTTLCPQFYNRGISWLREADQIVYQRTWFKITSVWVGGPVGQWDRDIYSSAPSPYG